MRKQSETITKAFIAFILALKSKIDINSLIMNY